VSSKPFNLRTFDAGFRQRRTFEDPELALAPSISLGRLMSAGEGKFQISAPGGGFYQLGVKPGIDPNSAIISSVH
jgi:hypothetical protein